VEARLIQGYWLVSDPVLLLYTQVADFSAFVKEHASKPITRELSVGAVKAEKVPHPSCL
jgi:hypothetical protein